jgi:putative nucleotidyltransferase with HDIG domain
VPDSTKGRLYIAAVALAGWTTLALSITHWHTTNWINFGIYLGVSIFASGFKLRLPGVTGTVSAAFFPVLIGIVCLSVPEALTAACAGVLMQCIWHSRKRQFVKIVFNVASVALAVAAAAAVFHSQWLHQLQFEYAVRLAILGVTYFVANTLPVCAVIGITEEKSIWKVWRNSCFWSFPHYLAGAAAAGLFELTVQLLGWQTALLFIPVSCLLYRASSLHIGRMDDARQHADDTAALYLRTITSLAGAIEAKDSETSEHLQRVQVYAMEIGRDLRLSESEIEALRAAALLHDIGKIAVPDHIIGKPGKLTPAEFQRMKIHPVVGAEILERVNFPFPVAPVVRCHHEKWDGSGYPAGLQGEEIPIGARILAAVDCLDAVASDRHYRRALPLDQAMALIERESDRAFDPQVVEALKRRYIELEQMVRRAASIEPWHLSTNICIERGEAPGAGFAAAPLPAAPSGRSPAAASDLVRLRCFVEAITSGERFLNLSEVLSIFTDRLGKVVWFDSVAVYVSRRGRLAAIHAAGKERATLASAVIPFGQGVSGWAVNANRPILNGNPAVELCHSTIPCHPGALGSVLSMPLPGAMGPVGVLALYGAAENSFNSEDLSLIAEFAPQLGGYLDRDAGDVMPVAPRAPIAAFSLMVN